MGKLQALDLTIVYYLEFEYGRRLPPYSLFQRESIIISFNVKRNSGISIKMQCLPATHGRTRCVKINQVHMFCIDVFTYNIYINSFIVQFMSPLKLADLLETTNYSIYITE